MMTKKNDLTTILLQRDVIHQRHQPLGIPLVLDPSVIIISLTSGHGVGLGVLGG